MIPIGSERQRVGPIYLQMCTIGGVLIPNGSIGEKPPTFRYRSLPFLTSLPSVACYHGCRSGEHFTARRIDWGRTQNAEVLMRLKRRRPCGRWNTDLHAAIKGFERMPDGSLLLKTRQRNEQVRLILSPDDVRILRTGLSPTSIRERLFGIT